MHDVIVIGGSFAGISATLQLARARRDVLVIDGGERRNRFAPSAHGFLGQDGVAPGAIAAKGKAEVLAYPTVAWREAVVTEARTIPGGFAVRMGTEEAQAKRLILATGIRDELPDVPGLDERWGTTVFHCPFCHGYELHRGRIGVLAAHPLAFHHAALVSAWGGSGLTTVFLNDAFEPDGDQLAELAHREIRLERARVVEAAGVAPRIDVRLADGRVIELDGLFLMARTHIRGPFAEQLGCETEAGPLGAFYKTDPMKQTTVPGVFACGDVALPMGMVALAVADGAMAGASVMRSLVFG